MPNDFLASFHDDPSHRSVYHVARAPSHGKQSEARFFLGVVIRDLGNG